MKLTENYVYKKEVDWSLLNEGVTLPVKDRQIFGRYMGSDLIRGQSKNITLYFFGQNFEAKLVNVKLAEKHFRKNDVLQIRYSPSGDLSSTLKSYFNKSYKYISEQRSLREKGDKHQIHLPEEYKEYLVIYTTNRDDVYILEPILSDDLYLLKDAIIGQNELLFESDFALDLHDDKSTIYVSERIMKIRKLNRKIGDSLKNMYGYRCQICGIKVGGMYNATVIEAHHIDYFVKSMNNDYDNQMIVCPNHHKIIHDVNPKFDRKQLIYSYPNGYKEGLMINRHL